MLNKTNLRVRDRITFPVHKNESTPMHVDILWYFILVKQDKRFRFTKDLGFFILILLIFFIFVQTFLFISTQTGLVSKIYKYNTPVNLTVSSSYSASPTNGSLHQK